MVRRPHDSRSCVSHGLAWKQKPLPVSASEGIQCRDLVTQGNEDMCQTGHKENPQISNSRKPLPPTLALECQREEAFPGHRAAHGELGHGRSQSLGDASLAGCWRPHSRWRWREAPACPLPFALQYPTRASVRNLENSLLSQRPISQIQSREGERCGVGFRANRPRAFIILYPHLYFKTSSFCLT